MQMAELGRHQTFYQFLDEFATAPTCHETYDVIVIGSGGGGRSTAPNGDQIVLIERRPAACLNRGCPLKNVDPSGGRGRRDPGGGKI